MNISQIKRSVAAIANANDDPELAHSIQDVLYLAVLKAIAAGAPNAQELASEAIKAERIDYPKWYA